MHLPDLDNELDPPPDTTSSSDTTRLLTPDRDSSSTSASNSIQPDAAGNNNNSSSSSSSSNNNNSGGNGNGNGSGDGTLNNPNNITTTTTASDSLPWPALPGLPARAIRPIAAPEHWTLSRCPPELADIPPADPDDDDDDDAASRERDAPPLKRMVRWSLAPGLYLDPDDGDVRVSCHRSPDPDDAAGPSALTGTPGAKQYFMYRECSRCFNETPDDALIVLDRRHKFCSACLRALADRAMANEALFPPRCCGRDISLPLLLAHLDPDRKARFRARVREFALPPDSRWHCPHPACRRWIPPYMIDTAALAQTCPHCRSAICGVCRGSAHVSGFDCPRDFGMECAPGRAGAGVYGWRRCRECGNTVELIAGHKSVVCQCGSEVCSACGIEWPACDCTNDDFAKFRADLDSRRADTLARARNCKSIMDAALRHVTRAEGVHLAASRQQAAEQQQRQREAAATAKIKPKTPLQRQVDGIVSRLTRRLAFLDDRQRAPLTARHHAQAAQLHAAISDARSAHHEARARMLEHLRSNVDTRRAALAARHAAAAERLRVRGETDEDDTLASLARLLPRDTPNREMRERAILTRLRTRHDAEVNQLETEHANERAALAEAVRLENTALTVGADLRWRNSTRDLLDQRRALAHAIAADRAWAEAVARARVGLVVRCGRLAVAAESENGLCAIPDRDAAANSGTAGHISIDRLLDRLIGPVTPPARAARLASRARNSGGGGTSSSRVRAGSADSEGTAASGATGRSGGGGSGMTTSAAGAPTSASGMTLEMAAGRSGSSHPGASALANGDNKLSPSRAKSPVGLSPHASGHQRSRSARRISVPPPPTLAQMVPEDESVAGFRPYSLPQAFNGPTPGSDAYVSSSTSTISSAPPSPLGSPSSTTLSPSTVPHTLPIPVPIFPTRQTSFSTINTSPMGASPGGSVAGGGLSPRTVPATALVGADGSYFGTAGARASFGAGMKSTLGSPARSGSPGPGTKIGLPIPFRPPNDQGRSPSGSGADSPLSPVPPTASALDGDGSSAASVSPGANDMAAVLSSSGVTGYDRQQPQGPAVFGNPFWVGLGLGLGHVDGLIGGHGSEYYAHGGRNEEGDAVSGRASPAPAPVAALPVAAGGGRMGKRWRFKS